MYYTFLFLYKEILIIIYVYKDGFYKALEQKLGDAALSFSMAKLSNYVETLEHTIEELKNENNNLKSKIEDLYKLIVK